MGRLKLIRRKEEREQAAWMLRSFIEGEQLQWSGQRLDNAAQAPAGV
ncbi:MAG: hypothetical protein SW833_05765 [Cyanobacteriota bacterium]|nr:hypothetical protein [Cyanobacteriota bacterium]